MTAPARRSIAVTLVALALAACGPGTQAPLLDAPTRAPLVAPTRAPAATPTLTPRGAPSPKAPPPTKNCDPSYPGVCIPPPPPDLNCKDVSFRRFKVTGADPHNFDGNHDGVGCET